MPELETPQSAATSLMRFLKLHPPAEVTWNGRNLIVMAAGQVLPERPTVWQESYEVIYRS